MTGDTAGGHDAADQAGAIDASTTGDTHPPTTPTGPERGADHRAETVTQRRALLAGLGGLAAGAMFASRTQAGPLNPPAGHITSTGKTLTDIEPRIAVSATNTPGDATSVFRITQPGSYYLSGNVIGAAGRDGITIAASNVTLDLNGFSVIGVAGALRGVHALGGSNQVIVRNGSVTDWPGGGVRLGAGTGDTNYMVEDVIAASNGVHGIFASSNAVIARCLSHGNGANGINVSTSAVVSQCFARENGGDGFFLGNASSVDSCSSRGNGGNGFAAGSAATLHTCTATQNTLSGFSAGFGSLFRGCAAEFNTEHGMVVTAVSAAIDCVVRSNTLHGIRASSGATVRGCACHGNGTSTSSAGINAVTNDTRIEGNTCTGNFIGILVTGGGHFITRNTCSGNTSLNWSVANGNVCLVVNASLAGAISGNAGGTAPGSTDPNANFSF